MSFHEQLEAKAVAPVTSIKELMQEQAGGGGRGDIIRINPYRLKIKEGRNLRNMDNPAVQAHIDWLASSIAENGVLTPILIQVEDGTPYVVHGECRTHAVKKAIEELGAEIATVPCIHEPKGMTEADRVALTAQGYNGGMPITPLEQAEGIKRLVQWGWTHANIAKRFGISLQRLGQLFDLTTLPEQVKEEIREGNISATMAQQTIAELGKEAGTKMVKAAVVVAKAEKAAGKGKGKVKAKHLGKSKAAPISPATKAQNEKMLREKAKSAKFLAERIDVLRTLWLKGVPAVNNGRVAVAWTEADYNEIVAKLGVKVVKEAAE